MTVDQAYDQEKLLAKVHYTNASGIYGRCAIYSFQITVRDDNQSQITDRDEEDHSKSVHARCAVFIPSHKLLSCAYRHPSNGKDDADDDG